MMPTTMMRMVGAVMLLAAAACGKKDATGATTQAQAAPLAGTPTHDWSKVIVATPEGGFRMGNPKAKVKFVEYASLTCPHCRDFHKESDADLVQMVAHGGVSYEYRNFVLNAPDTAVTLLARCQTPAGFFKIEDALYNTQETWFGRIASSPDAQKQIAALPIDQQPLAMIRAMKLDDFFKLRGVTEARLEACLSDKAGQTRLGDAMKLGESKYQVSYTPFFVLNETPNQDLHTWPEVKNAIEAALRA